MSNVYFSMTCNVGFKYSCAQLIVKALKQLAAIAANFLKKTIQESFKKISKNSIKNSQHP